MEFLPDAITVSSLTAGAAPVTASFGTVIFITVGISLGVFGIGLIVASVARALSAASSMRGSARGTTFGKG